MLTDTDPIMTAEITNTLIAIYGLALNNSNLHEVHPTKMKETPAV